MGTCKIRFDTSNPGSLKVLNNRRKIFRFINFLIHITFIHASNFFEIDDPDKNTDSIHRERLPDYPVPARFSTIYFYTRAKFFPARTESPCDAQQQQQQLRQTARYTAAPERKAEGTRPYPGRRATLSFIRSEGGGDNVPFERGGGGRDSPPSNYRQTQPTARLLGRCSGVVYERERWLSDLTGICYR